jgi:hypothetical protein
VVPHQGPPLREEGDPDHGRLVSRDHRTHREQRAAADRLRGRHFSRAAELIKHTYSGWTQAGRFAGKLRTVYLPTVIAGRPNNQGN